MGSQEGPDHLPRGRMKVSFGMIVFDAMNVLPAGMLRACIENVLPVAHEILIVEGATKAQGDHYWDGDASLFTQDGRSHDGTLELLREMAAKNPKIKLIEGQGFWPGKTSMCNAYAECAVGDYLWQLDADEFYHQEDMQKIVAMLKERRPDAVHFYANHFWGGWTHCMDEVTDQRWSNQFPWRRIFRHIPGKSQWITHEPPSYMADGVTCNNGNVVTRDVTLAMGVKLHHYGYVHRKQAEWKERFYLETPYRRLWDLWQQDHTTNILGGYTKRFTGQHPAILKDIIR